eukprot:12057392-Heterocapsa_arctica.AAC.1
MLAKVQVFGSAYFRSGWNVFDFAIAWIAVMDAWLIPLFVPRQNLGWLKSFRLMRLLRIAKVVHVIPELTM